MARNYAALPHEYIEEFKELSYEEIGILLMALLQYSATGEEPELKGNERFLWRRVAAQENRFQESYEEIANARREAAKKAARSRWSVREDADACERMPSDASNANTNTDTETHTETKTKTKPLPSIEGELFAPPTAEEVASYAREQNSSVDPGRFVDYYASRGWKIGNAPMEDWRAAFRNWEREERHRGNAAGSPQRVQRASEEYRPRDTALPSPDDTDTLAQLERLRQKMRSPEWRTGDKPTPRGA